MIKRIAIISIVLVVNVVSILCQNANTLVQPPKIYYDGAVHSITQIQSMDTLRLEPVLSEYINKTLPIGYFDNCRFRFVVKLKINKKGEVTNIIHLRDPADPLAVKFFNEAIKKIRFIPAYKRSKPIGCEIKVMMVYDSILSNKECSDSLNGWPCFVTNASDSTFTYVMKDGRKIQATIPANIRYIDGIDSLKRKMVSELDDGDEDRYLRVLFFVLFDKNLHIDEVRVASVVPCDMDCERIAEKYIKYLHHTEKEWIPQGRREWYVCFFR